MTDENESAPAQAEKKRMGYLGAIAALQEAIDDDSDSDGAFDVTLLVSGWLVSGRVISAKRYFKLTETAIVNDVPDANDEAKSAMSEFFEGTAWHAHGDRQTTDPVAVYLRDVVIIQGSQRITTTKPGLWRVVLDHIAAATFGRVQ